MSYSLTTNYNLKKIDFDTEENTWGDILNENWDNADAGSKHTYMAIHKLS